MWLIHQDLVCNSLEKWKTVSTKARTAEIFGHNQPCDPSQLINTFLDDETERPVFALCKGPLGVD